MSQKSKSKSTLPHKFSVAEEVTLPAWAHTWGQEPSVVVKGQHVLLKSMSVFVKSDGTTHPDAKTLSFPTTGTTVVGCCLCIGEVQAGRGGWGFKTHCVRSHAWVCSYEDLQSHSAGLLKVLESACSEAVREEADPAAAGQR